MNRVMEGRFLGIYGWQWLPGILILVGFNLILLGVTGPYWMFSDPSPGASPGSYSCTLVGGH